MIFRILGPLLVEDGQGTRTLAAPKQRVILASLLLRPNQVVPVADLLDRVWGKHHPASATATLYNHVARLRRSLGDEAGARVLTRAPGYLVEIRDDRELDLGRFHALRATAANAAQDGDHDRAADLLRQALGLWRGNALSDVPAGATHSPDTEQLDELRLAVRQQCVEYDLECGAAESLLPELRHLLAAHPFREDLYGQLMRALYRSGRQAEALDVFRTARATLLDELGVEPGPALQRLHASVLRQDPVLVCEQPGRLRPPPSPASAEPACPPVQLPPGVPDFTGRREEVAAVIAALTADGGDGPRVAAVSGPAGVGTTELALRTAWRLRGTFTDGVLFADLRGQQCGPADPADVLAAFARALGAAEDTIPAGQEPRAALYRGLTARRRLLVVLDGAAGSSQVRPLLPGPGSAALVTGRRRLTGLAGARLFDVGPLPQADAAELFGKVSGRGHDEPDAVAAITARCGRLPLALRIAGARLAARPAWSARELADRLADRRHRMDELRTEDLDVRAGLVPGYTALPGPHARAFRLLALADAPTLPLPVAAAMLDLPRRGAERILEELVDAHLLTSPRQGSYGFHDLVRLFGEERSAASETAQERLAAVRRGAGAALARVDQLDPRGRQAVRGAGRSPGNSGHDGPAWLRPAPEEVENLCAWIRQLFATDGMPVSPAPLDTATPAPLDTATPAPLDTAAPGRTSAAVRRLRLDSERAVGNRAVAG